MSRFRRTLSTALILVAALAATMFATTGAAQAGSETTTRAQASSSAADTYGRRCETHAAKYICSAIRYDCCPGVDGWSKVEYLKTSSYYRIRTSIWSCNLDGSYCSRANLTAWKYVHGISTVYNRTEKYYHPVNSCWYAGTDLQIRGSNGTYTRLGHVWSYKHCWWR
ncbi:MAG: hypothetical protein ACRDT6_10970 [Micromonosporaceae bacterium]